jgi:hypothetical protein
MEHCHHHEEEEGLALPPLVAEPYSYHSFKFEIILSIGEDCFVVYETSLKYFRVQISL